MLNYETIVYYVTLLEIKHVPTLSDIHIEVEYSGIINCNIYI